MQYSRHLLHGGRPPTSGTDRHAQRLQFVTGRRSECRTALVVVRGAKSTGRLAPELHQLARRGAKLRPDETLCTKAATPPPPSPPYRRGPRRALLSCARGEVLLGVTYAIFVQAIISWLDRRTVRSHVRRTISRNNNDENRADWFPQTAFSSKSLQRRVPAGTRRRRQPRRTATANPATLNALRKASALDHGHVDAEMSRGAAAHAREGGGGGGGGGYLARHPSRIDLRSRRKAGSQ